MAQFPITEILTDNVWVDNKPAIKEFHPTGNPVQTNTDRRYKAFRAEEDPNLHYLLRFCRIAIIRSISRDAIDQSLSRTHENDASLDTFRIIVKTGSYKDTNDVFNTIRDILLAQNTAGNYPWWDVGNAVDTPQRGKFAREFDVLAYRSGTVRDHSELILNEAFTHDDDTTPDNFTPAWSYTKVGSGDPGENDAYVSSNQLKIVDETGAGNVLLVTPSLTGTFTVNRIKFSLNVQDITVTGLSGSSSEWTIYLVNDLDTTLFTLYIHMTDEEKWGFRWSAGNDGYLTTENQEVDVKIEFTTSVISLWVDDESIFSEIDLDTAGTVTKMKIESCTLYGGPPRQLDATVIVDDYMAIRVPTELLTAS